MNIPEIVGALVPTGPVSEAAMAYGNVCAKRLLTKGRIERHLGQSELTALFAIAYEAGAKALLQAQGGEVKDDLVEVLRAMARERDEYINDNDGHNPWADPGCIECTEGVTPDRYNTGPCAYHRACAALIAAGEKP